MWDKNVYWALVVFVVLFGGIYAVFGFKYISWAQKLAAINTDIYNKLEWALQNPTKVKKELKTVTSPDAVEFITPFVSWKKEEVVIISSKPNVIVVDSPAPEVKLPAPREVIKRLNFDVEYVESLTWGVEGLKLTDSIKSAYEKMLEIVSKAYTGNVRVLSDEEMVEYNMPGHKVVFLNLEEYKGKYIFMLVDSRRGLWFLIIKPEVYGESLKQWLKDYFNS